MYGTFCSDKIRFTVYNEVFYNGYLRCFGTVLQDLNLVINNFTRIDITLDSYFFNSEQTIRQALKNKQNQVKLNGTIIKNRNMIIKERKSCNSGTLNNPYKLRTIEFKDKKKTKELSCYDKTEEIKYISNKDYIFQYHKKQNPKLKKIYRSEIRLKYEAISRYCKTKIITLNDLLNQDFLYSMFTEHLDRILTIYDGSNRKKEKIQLVDSLKKQHSEGILQPTLPMYEERELNSIINKEINFNNIKNESDKNIYDYQTIYNKTTDNQRYKVIENEKRKELIRRNEEENKQFIKRVQESKLWATTLIRA